MTNLSATTTKKKKDEEEKNEDAPERTGFSGSSNNSIVYSMTISSSTPDNSVTVFVIHGRMTMGGRDVENYGECEV